MKRILAALLCLAGLAAAQTYTTGAAGEKPRWIQKVFDVKYANPSALADLLSDLVPAGSSERIKFEQNLHVVSIGTHDPSFLAMAEEIIKRYDVPREKVAEEHRHGVEVVAHILLAGPKGSTGDAVPQSLEPVVKQLRSVFGYTDIRLLDSSLIVGRENRSTEVSGTFGQFMEVPKIPTRYRVGIKNIWVSPSDKGNSVTLEGFRFDVVMPYEQSAGQYQSMDVGFNTELNVREGQQVVVGKSHIGTGTDALILVLSARVVD